MTTTASRTPPTPGAVEAAPRTPAGRLAAVAPYLSGVLATLWFFRTTLLDGRLPGDRIDARWSVTVLEHWFDVWRGEAAIRDLGVYVPLDETLGLSDPFLVQGQFHALARMAGMDVVPAWFLAHLVTFLIGALGVAALGRRLLDGTVAPCVLVLTSALSYPMVAQIGHVQNYGILWMAWVAWAIHGLLWPERPVVARRAAAVLLVLPPVIALSSWYGLVLGTVVLLVLGLVSAVLCGPRRTVATARRAVVTFAGALRSPAVATLAVAGLALWGLVAWIFLPSRGLLRPTRWEEVSELGPRWSDVLDAGMGGGGVWSPLYDRPDDLAGWSETALGFTPLLALCLVGVALVAAGRIVARRPDRGTDVHVLAGAVAVLAVLALVVTDEHGGPYELLWDHVPIFSSVRAPFRVQILLYPLAVYLVLKAVAAVPRAAVVAGVLGVVLLVEMHRPAAGSWTERDLLRPGLADVVDEVDDAGCVALVMDVPPGPAFVTTQVDATILSMLTGVPTAHGYGRGPPERHPGWVAPPGDLVDWVRDQGVDGPVCLVSSGRVEIER